MRATVTFKQLLAECVLANNALVSHAGATQYHARFGATPAMLPDPWQVPDDTAQGPGRYLHRIREIALQKIIESTAQARVRRALGGRTSVPGEVLDYVPGELVEFYRPPSSKDVSGWQGPAPVVENHPSRGHVSVQWKGTHDYCAVH